MTSHFSRVVRGDTKVTGETSVYHLLLDVSVRRIETMDRAGIQYAILSLNTPGIQGETDKATAVRSSKFANDELRRIIDRHPDRFGGFAAPHAGSKSCRTRAGANCESAVISRAAGQQLL
jgi:predicted TIM-barrel fold metal-dependent hydrolase